MEYLIISAKVQLPQLKIVTEELQKSAIRGDILPQATTTFPLEFIAIGFIAIGSNLLLSTVEL